MERALCGVERGEQETLMEAACQIRGETPYGQCPDFERVSDDKMRKIDIYTDGTVDTPKTPCYAVGAAAAWRVEGRETAEGGRIRDDYAMMRWPMGRGVAWLMEVKGRVQSSTRSEIMGGLLATLNEQAVHIWTDSKCFRNMHKKVAAKIAGAKVQPFARMRNGDLAKNLA